MKSNASKWIVVVLWIFAAMDIVNGIEMFFFPSAWFFRLVPGVTETGPFNAHLGMDGGTFFLAVGIRLGPAVLDARPNAIAGVVAGIAGSLFTGLHAVSHWAGLHASYHIVSDVVG